jgi:hypothetical protein
MNFKSASLTLATAGFLLSAPFSASALEVSVPGHVPAGNINVLVSLTNPKDLAPIIETSRLSKEYQDVMNLALADDEKFIEVMQKIEKFYSTLGENVTLGSMVKEIVTGLDFYAIPNEEGDLEGLALIEFSNNEQAQAFLDFLRSEAKATNEENIAKGLPAKELLEKEVAGLMVQNDPSTGEYNAVKDNVVFLSSGGEAILTSSILSTGAESLSTLPNLSLLEGKLAQTGDLNLYFNMDELIKSNSELADMSSAGGQTLVSVDFDGLVVKSNYYYKPTTISESRKALMAIPAADNKEISGFVPTDGIIGYSMNLLDNAVMTKGYADLQANPEVAGNIAMMESVFTESGLSIKDDIIPAFGPTMGFSLGKPDPTMPLPIPSITAVFKVADQAKANLVMTKMEENLVKQSTTSARQMNPDAPEATVQTKDYNGTPIRTVDFSTPFAKISTGHALTSDGYYLLTIGGGGIESALASKLAGTGISSDQEWKSVSPEFFQTYNHFAKLDAAALSGFIRQLVPIVSGFSGSSPEDIKNFGEFLDIVESLGTLNNANRNDETGVHGFTVLQLQ